MLLKLEHIKFTQFGSDRRQLQLLDEFADTFSLQGVGLVCAFLRPSPAAQICEHDHHNRNIFGILKRDIALKIETKPRDRKKTFFSQTKELASCAFATRKLAQKSAKKRHYFQNKLGSQTQSKRYFAMVAHFSARGRKTTHLPASLVQLL